MISQLAPAATASPFEQGVTNFVFLTVASAKSPLGAMLVMFSVALPELVTITFFAGLVVPTILLGKVSDVGFRVTAGAPAPVTVRLNVVLCVKAPDTPVIVTVAVPVAAVPLAVNVSVLVEVVGFGLNCAVTPLGRPVALNVTLPVKPSSGVTVIVLVPLAPCAMVSVFGFAAKLKSGDPPPQPGKMKLPIAVLQLNPWLTPVAFR